MEKVNKQPSSSSFDKVERQETTESSSSFDDTDSEVGNSDTLDYSEASSGFHREIDCIGFGDVLSIKKKKLTNHWRSFIQPLMWRCKWAELQILKLESQAQKYDRKLRKYERQKKIQLENSTLEELGVKSVPFSWNNARRDVFRRKKRRKIETTNISEYMSNHNLFSFYENRNGVTKGVLKVNEFNHPEKVTQKVKFEDEFWESDEPSCLQPDDDDNSLEPILRKIDFLQSQVGKLKNRVDKILTEKAEILSCLDNSNLPMSCDDLIGSPQNSDSPPNNRDTMTIGARLASQLLSEYFADAFENGEEDVLIDDQRVKEKMNNLEDLNILPIQRPPLARTALVPEEPDLPTKLTSPISSGKKGRGRDASRGRWRFTS